MDLVAQQVLQVAQTAGCGSAQGRRLVTQTVPACLSSNHRYQTLADFKDDTKPASSAESDSTLASARIWRDLSLHRYLAARYSMAAVSPVTWM